MLKIHKYILINADEEDSCYLKFTIISFVRNVFSTLQNCLKQILKQTLLSSVGIRELIIRELLQLRI